MKEIKTLHEKALTVTSNYRKAEWQMIDILQELDREKLYYYYNCKSLFQYCMKHLKLSESASCSLIRLSRTSEQVPELKEKVKTGEISTSKASRICSVLKPEKPDHTHRYAKPKDLSLKECQENREHNQNWLKKAAILTSKELEKEIIKERPQDFTKKENKRQLSEDFHSLNLKLSNEEMELLERLKEVTKKDSYGEALKAAAQFYLDKKDPIKKKTKKEFTLHTQAKIIGNNERQKRRKVPEKVRVALYKKQKATCLKCGARKGLEIHHIKPVSLGGTNELENLELVCSSCHKQHHFWDHSLQKRENISSGPPN